MLCGWPRFLSHAYHERKVYTQPVVVMEAANLRVPNLMKRMRRWHDFASGRDARRSEYREYLQAARQSPGAKLAPALRVVAKIGTGFVGLVAHTPGMRRLALRATADFGHNDA